MAGMYFGAYSWFYCCLVAKSCPTLLLSPWTVACLAPLSVGFPGQEYCSGLPFPSPGDLPNLGIEPMSLALAGGFSTTEPPGKSLPQIVAYYLTHF